MQAAREYTCRTQQVCGRPPSEASDAEVPEATAVSAAMLLSQHQHLHYHEGSAQQQTTSGGQHQDVLAIAAGVVSATALQQLCDSSATALQQLQAI